MLNLSIQASKKFFFDRIKLLNKVDAMRVKAVFRQAMFLKVVAQRLMRPGGKKGVASKPGEPPRTHGERLLREKLFGVFDSSTQSGVIGPALLNGRARRNHGKTVPETLEFGGQVDVWGWKDGGWKPVRTAYIEPRPYMSVAEKRTRARFAEQFRGAFREAA